MTKSELATKVEAFLLTLEPHDKDDYYASERERSAAVMGRFFGFIGHIDGTLMCEKYD